MSKKEETTKAVVVAADYKESYPVLFSQVNIGEAMKENFDGQDITARELFYQVKVPSGGGTEFTTIDASGEEVGVKEIAGIILHIGNTRAYHEGDFGTPGSDKVPTCSSEDGETGVGQPGGACVTCAMNEFGSAKNKRAKACSEYKPVYMLVPGVARPIAIRVSSGSFGPLKDYNVDISMSGIVRYSIETVFSLKKVKGEPDYSQVVIRKGSKISDPVVLELVNAYRKSILPFLDPQQRPKPMHTEQAIVTETAKTEPVSGGFIHDADAIEAELDKAS